MDCTLEYRSQIYPDRREFLFWRKGMTMFINQYTRFGLVEGLGDEEIPWWIAPYVRDFAALARSTAVLENLTAKPETALASLTRRVAETASVARVAAHVKNEALSAGVSSSLRRTSTSSAGRRRIHIAWIRLR